MKIDTFSRIVNCEHVRATRSSSVVTLSRLPTSSLRIAHFAMHQINFLSHFVILADDVTLSNSPPTLHHTFTVSFQAQNSPFPQIYS